MNKNIIALVLCGALLLGVGFGVGLLVGGNQSVDTLAGGTRFVHGLSTTSAAPSAGEVQTTTLTVDSTTTLTGVATLSASSVSMGGVVEYSYSSALSNASSTLCQFTSPAATTTLEFASVTVTTASSTAAIIQIAKSKYQSATTTLIASTYTVAANAKATIVASSTGFITGVTNTWVIGPSQYIVVKAGGTSFKPTKSGINTYAGYCKLKLLVN